MRRRILQSTLLVVAITALVLGGPLAITTWRLVEDIHRADLLSRLEQVAALLDSAAALDRASIELAVPTGGRLVLQRAGEPDQVIGVDVGDAPNRCRSRRAMCSSCRSRCG